MMSRLNNATRGLNLFSKMALEEKSVATPAILSQTLVNFLICFQLFIFLCSNLVIYLLQIWANQMGEKQTCCCHETGLKQILFYQLFRFCQFLSLFSIGSLNLIRYKARLPYSVLQAKVIEITMKLMYKTPVQ